MDQRSRPRKQPHPYTELLPRRADVDDLALDIAHNGQREPVWLYEKQIIEGRVREQACLQLGIQPQYKEWVLSHDSEPLDWMVRRYVEQHNPTELERLNLAAAVLPYYREMPGSTETALSRATGISHRKARALNWLEQVDKLEPVLSGEIPILDAAREIGLVGERHTIALGVGYGKGDKFDESTQPLRRYLTAWKRKNFEFRHVNPKEAARRLQIIDQLAEDLRSARTDIERRSHAATLSAPPERKERS